MALANKDDIAAVLTGMFKAMESDNLNQYNEIKGDASIKGAVKSLHHKNPEDFYFNVIYPFYNVISGLIQTEEKNYSSRLIFLFTHSQFIQSNFERLFVLHEGGACCCDKSRSIIKAIARFLIDDKQIEFNYSQEFTYHLPKKIFKTHDSIFGFFDALYDLHHGRHEKYLVEMVKIHKQTSKDGK